jgi:formylglycine-generating enzyme required for sulfatase activity
MNNVSIKSSLMNNGYSDIIDLIELNKSLWGYEYYTSQSVNPIRYSTNELQRIRLIPFDYKGIKFNMITCPAGRKVSINKWGEQEIKEPFMLGETEVTQELFKALMGFNYSESENPKNPVEKVTWYDCLDFCNRLSDYFEFDHYYILRDKEFVNKYYTLSIETAKITFNERAKGFRLPKEWEWQIAAMAGTNNKYAGANDDKFLKRVAWFEDNSNYKIHPVAQKLPNEWGFYDMSGNLNEWCDNATDPAENKNHLASRIYRGGSCDKNALYLSSTGRNRETPSERYKSIGFRIAKSI